MEQRGQGQQIRDQAQADAVGLQVFTLRDPVVTELAEAALLAEQRGELDRAERLLERALGLAPEDPELYQQLAELRLTQQRWMDALEQAQRSWSLGSQVGALCQRNWQTKSLAHQQLADEAAARDARLRGQRCVVRPPERF